jgi:mono/diheme cytochrome c family protein
VTTGLVTGSTNFVELNPLPVTDELLQRGQQVFNINCAACHSKVGDGSGTPKRIGAMAVVANLHDKRIVELADGELFNTISYGKNLMQGYAANLPIQDRWAAVAYLRALQLSRLGALDEVPEAAPGALKK